MYQNVYRKFMTTKDPITYQPDRSDLVLLLIFRCIYIITSWYMYRGSYSLYDLGMVFSEIDVSDEDTVQIIYALSYMIHKCSRGIWLGLPVVDTGRAIIKCHFSRHLSCSISGCSYTHSTFLHTTTYTIAIATLFDLYFIVLK